jgi:heat shock protein HspQ
MLAVIFCLILHAWRSRQQISELSKTVEEKAARIHALEVQMDPQRHQPYSSLHEVDNLSYITYVGDEELRNKGANRGQIQERSFGRDRS